MGICRFRVDDVHHHSMPGFSLFFICVLQCPVVNENNNLLILLEQLHEIVLRVGALVLVSSRASTADQRHQRYLYGR